MNLIAVDVGNTSTAIGLWSDGVVSRVVHCDGTFKEAASLLDRLLSSSRRRISAIAYASVVPEVDARWQAHAKRRKLPFHAVSWRDVERPSIDYPHPETIGADRLADAAGAFSRYGAPVVVMDFGTAFTAAVITDDGVWRGGAIAPGFPLMSDYLFERTAKLPKMDFRRVREPRIGRSTEEAMRFGAIVGYRGMVREIAETISRNFRTDFTFVATGGFAAHVVKGLDIDFKVDRTLTLYGTGLLCLKRF